MHKADARGRLTTYAKTERSRRRVPLRAKVVAAFGELPQRDGIVTDAARGTSWARNRLKRRCRRRRRMRAPPQRGFSYMGAAGFEPATSRV